MMVIFRFFPSAIFAVCLLTMIGQSGCRRGGPPFVVREASVLPDASEEAPIEVVRQDFSMAKQLRKTIPSEYVLGPGDAVEITVFRHDDLRMQTAVSTEGKIAYYLVGDIRAGGLTSFELRDEIRKKLAVFIKNPEVVVNVVEYRSHKVFVLGQVSNPGVFNMRGDFTLVEAISSAGGVGPDAYLGGAYIVRDEKVLLVNFFELIEKGNMTENIFLHPNDVIYIPDARDHKVFVLGEVNRQTAVPIREKLTLFEAIAEAGGFTRDANKEAVLVMRGNLSAPEIFKVDAGRMTPATNIALERGDIIYVSSTTFANLERIAVRLQHILDPFYTLVRGVVWGSAAIDVLEGEKTRFVGFD